MDNHPQGDTAVKAHRIARLAGAGVHFLYSALIKPKSYGEDASRKELMLNIVLLGSTTLLALLDASLIYNTISKGDSFTGAAFWKFSLLVALFASLYALSRNGFTRPASYAVVGLYFLGASVSAATWGATLPASLLGYALVITISSVLISSRFGFGVSLATFGALIVLGRREIESGVIPPWKNEMVTTSDLIVYALILLVIALISWLSNRETENSLARARQSETALALEKGSLEAKVRERTEELQKAQVEKMTSLSRFAEFGRLSSGLFHDLINPLSAIAMNLQELKGKTGSESDDIRELLERAMKASKRMGTFTSSIRKQIRADDFKEIFSANEIIEEASSLFHYKAARSNIFIHFEAAESLSLYGNPIKFHQIFSNLISNAVDSYLPATNDADARKEKVVRVSLRRKSKNIIAIVEDHGCGMTADVIERIYDQFFTTKDRDSSMGLGLSTVKDIVENEFDGSIRVTSEPRKGSRFTVTLPHIEKPHAAA